MEKRKMLINVTEFGSVLCFQYFCNRKREKEMLDYENIRANAAINVLNAILSSSLMFLIVEFILKKEIIDVCLKYADALVDELKKRENNKNEKENDQGKSNPC